jgi:hypothetical protein
MPRVSTQDAPELIRNRTPFTTNGSMAANQERHEFVVRSYGVPILILNTDTRTATMNETKHSHTTSVHQGKARQTLPSFLELGWKIRHAYTQEELDTMTHP